MRHSLDIVSKLVKCNILNDFSKFPTRMHVLTHCLLENDNGFEWIQHSDGLFYLEKSIPDNSEQADSIQLLDVSVEIDDLENFVRKWINDNINLYCLPEMFEMNFDFKPKLTSNFASLDLNLLSEIQDMSNIAVEWQDAIAEVCFYYMRLIFPDDPINDDAPNRVTYFKKQFLILLDSERKVHDCNMQNPIYKQSYELSKKTLEDI